MTLFQHQKRFLQQNPNKALLLWETGTGKTLAACEWIKKRPNRYTLIVCPKAITKKWLTALEESGVDDLRVLVLTRDEVKKHNISACNALVIDEAHDFAAPLFDKSRSQRATKIYNHIKQYPDTHVLLLTATPIRSTPYNLHTLACYMGTYWPIREFRNEYFYFTDMYGRWHYEPRKDWRTKIRQPLEKLADIALMKDCIDVPRQTHTVINIPYERYIPEKYMEPAAQWHDMHRKEQNEDKWTALKKLIDGYQKIMVVAYYREQIDDYVSRLKGEREVHVLHGGVRDQEAVIQAAQASKDCVFIVQSGLGSGFDADSFSVMVFASQGYSYVSHVQMEGRIRRIHNLHENQYYYLIAGEADKAVREAMEAGKDFDPVAYMLWRNHRG